MVYNNLWPNSNVVNNKNSVHIRIQMKLQILQNNRWKFLESFNNLPVPKNNMKQHPLPIGQRVISISGEQDDNDSGEPRKTGPDAVGTIQHVDHYEHQGWTYGVLFANGTCVFIDQNQINSDNYFCF